MKKNNKYQKLSVRICSKFEDLWIAHCFEHGASGIETTDEKASVITMSVYFTDISILMKDVFELFYHQYSPDFKDLELLNLEIHSNIDWLSAWKQHFHPIHIHDQFIVCPPWDIPKTGKDTKTVIINPGNGFGSGSHPSTVVALKLLVSYLEKSSKQFSILDVGTGSGILLIAAKNFDGKQFVGIDIDFPSIIDAQKNIKLNKMDPILPICGSPECIHFPFDIVISNMMLNELTSIRDDLIRNIGASGVLILSGFYVFQKKQIIDCFHELQIVSEIHDSQWAGVIMQKI